MINMIIDKSFIIYVKDYHHELLPRPQKKECKTESLKELQIISIDTGLWSSSV